MHRAHAGEPAISVTGLVKSFGDVRALDGVDLHVPAGSVLGLLGPNGAGKTTAVRVLTTLLKPDAGTVLVTGLDVVRDAAELRARIGLAGQYAAVDENLTGLENLVMVGRLYGMRRAEAKRRGQELLERFDLVEAADRPAKTYSGGMRRRLDLAAALVARPPVLFLDEPTTGLDPRSRLEVWATIEGLVAEGTTVLLTTQYLDEADRLADLIAVIDRGRVIAEGTPDELKDRVGGERLEVHLADASAVATAVRALAPMSDEPPVADGETVRLPVSRRSGTIVEAVRRLDDAGVAVDDLGLRRPTLDDVFLALTGHAAEATRRRRGEGGMRRLVSDTLVIAERNLVRLPRAPDLLIAFTVQPVMFVLLFVYVFGGAISTPGYDVRGLPDPGDHRPEHRLRRLRHGARAQRGPPQGPHRPLPLAADGAPGGAGRPHAVRRRDELPVRRRAARDGLIIGFSFHASVLEIVGGMALLMLFGYAFSWVFALLGLLVVLARVGQLDRLPRRLPADLHLVGLRAGRLDAARAAVVRRDQPVHDRGRRDAGALARRAGRQQRVGRGRVVARDPRGVRPAGRRALSPDRRAVSRPARRYAAAAAPRSTSLRSGSTHASAAR